MVMFCCHSEKLGIYAFLRMIFIFRVKVIVSANIDRPYPDRPFEGQMSFYVEYSGVAMNLDGFATVGTKMDEEQFGSSIQKVLEKTFKSSRAIDLESLCIITGQRVWNVRVDVHIIEDDGNAVDAAVAAVLAALTDFRRPDVEVTADQEVIVHSMFEKHPVPLSIHHFPASVSFALYLSSEGKILGLIDPTNLESSAQDGCVTMVLNRQGEIIYLNKPGGLEIDTKILVEELVPSAKVSSIKLLDLVSAAVSSRLPVRI